MVTIQSIIVYTMLQLYKSRQYFSGYPLYGLGPESILLHAEEEELGYCKWEGLTYSPSLSLIAYACDIKHEIKDLHVCESRESVQDACDLTLISCNVDEETTYYCFHTNV